MRTSSVNKPSRSLARTANCLRSKATPAFLRPFDQAAVGKSVIPRQGVNPGNPEGAELALFLLAVAVGKLGLFPGSIAGLAIKLAPAHVTGGELELAFMVSAGFGATLGTRHCGVKSFPQGFD